MADNKTKAPKRGISKARLLKAVEAILSEYGITPTDPVGKLTTAIEQDIIKDALDKA